ncbi:metallophosphoesterase [Ancylobacter rudongensis]|uniref:Serine/threonine protein phosphatase 1 n=1 Tax=Ancylobacter rudongensis TaxID=177413 RepID=A0A1G4UPB8_9HYPH|nr:metallophosphoesterase [Ancylobacter rudongensis]SCW95384.1 serine/threonine protein phosphatase 1 [Ancylobacter rudongensis]
MSYTYVIGDIHGRADLLTLALRKIADHAQEPGTIITLGDYTDRGPDSKGVVTRLMAGVSDGWKMINLMGNHEQMVFWTYRGKTKPDWWIDNGGDATIASYGGSRENIPVEHIEWMEQLPLFHEDEHRVYVHAWVDPHLPLKEQSDSSMLWVRYRTPWEGGWNDKHVVHGHTPVRGGPAIFEHRTNLDTGAFASGLLAVGVFDDAKPGGPVLIFNMTA